MYIRDHLVLEVNKDTDKLDMEILDSFLEKNLKFFELLGEYFNNNLNDTPIDLFTTILGTICIKYIHSKLEY